MRHQIKSIGDLWIIFDYSKAICNRLMPHKKCTAQHIAGNKDEVQTCHKTGGQDISTIVQATDKLEIDPC